MKANIIVKGGVEFLEVKVFGDSAWLNPHLINISQIRYIREYTETEGDRKAWAIVVGKKMLTTFDDIGLNRNIPGDTVKIGKQEFECAVGSSLTEKINNCLFFINYTHFLYVRKYIPPRDSNKSDNKKPGDKNSLENLKFALISTDDRIVPAEISLSNSNNYVVPAK